MKSNYNNIQWVIQRNLTNVDDLLTLKQSCDSIGVKYIEFDIIPFIEQLPEFDKSRHSIFYGSTTMGKLVYENTSLSKGFFFNEQSFSIANYFDNWGRHMLNFGAAIVSSVTNYFSKIV